MVNHIIPFSLRRLQNWFKTVAPKLDLQRPHVIEGDVFVNDEENMWVVVECMGAAVNDGVAILMCKLQVQLAPKKDKLGNYIRPVQEPGSDQDELSLLDFLSTEPETTDVQDCWSQLR
ncbi:hypothetical protein GGH12_001447 [Coemansia sp. RSA 1822]|nr:hypothetical protein GGF49_001262 [Coemansia sp. RSA 1853]KAJ2565414.1 hypothetical protein GGH12_001447 [Coemansia sp. RSA 1822]